MDMPSLQRFAPPAVTLLVCFLAYSSQWLFYKIEPGPLRKGDAYLFNALVASLLICYWRSCTTDPGRIPKDWHERLSSGEGSDAQAAQRQRWCRKCETYKPPRAHHCKACRRYVFRTNHATQRTLRECIAASSRWTIIVSGLVGKASFFGSEW
jgi:palmitoyltransferase